MNSRWISLAAALGIVLAGHRALPQVPPVPTTEPADTATPAATPAQPETPASATTPAIPDDPDAPPVGPKKKPAKHGAKKTKTPAKKGTGAEDIDLKFADYLQKPGQKAHDVVIMYGNARIEGEVEEDVVVLFGRTTVLGHVSGDVVNIGTGLFVEDGARIGGDAVGIGYGVIRGNDGMVGGGVVNLGLAALPENIRTRAMQYSDLCVLMARPLAPSLGWLWIGWGAMLLLHALLALIFPSAVRKILRTMEERPGGTALLGILGIPLLLVAVTIIGATVVLALALPFLLAAMVVGLLLGRTAIYQFLGRRILAIFDPGEPHPMLSFAVGAGLTTALFLVPVVGLIVWLIFCLWAIGGLLLTVFSKDGAKKSLPNPTAGPEVPVADGVVLPVVAFETPRVADTAAAGSFSGDTVGVMEPGMIPAAAFLAATTATATATATASGPGSGPVDPGTAGATGSAAMDAATIASAGRVPLFRRLAAVVVDWIPLLFLAAQLPHRFLTFDFGQHGFAVRAALAVLYFTGMIAWRGTTLGGILFGLRVVRQDGRPLTWEVAAVRALSAILSGLALGLGWIWSQWDARGQTWQDKLAGTVVVRDDAPRPLV